jgi:hypothetical protein
MKQRIIKTISALALFAITGCVALVFIGCQTRVTWTRNPETALPIQQVVEVNGVQQLATTGYQMAGGGWEVTARSPLWAKEQFSGFKVSVGTNGVLDVSLDTYDRDLSTNAVVLTKTIFDGSANLAQAVAKAYATISTGGSSDLTGAIVSKVVNYFKSKGGDASKSTVISDGTTIKVTDGSTCITCDADGNCTEGTCEYSP